MPTKVVRAAYVMPTLNRSHLHEQAYEQFAQQIGVAKHLYVYDESKEQSPFFSQRRLPDVTYVHRAGYRPNGVTRIGAARNAINSLVREPVIIHFDDDDLLRPEYGATMCRRLGDADIAKLDVWRLITDNNEFVFEWDTRRFGGWHFCLRGETTERVRADEDMSAEERDAYRDAFHIGFGWSLAYKTDLWRRFPFPAEGTEDIPWMRAVRDAGARIVFVSDCAHLALHTVHVDPNHPEGGSPHFPQRLLGRLNERMLGAAKAMEQLPEGKPVKIVPGETYRVLALVKKTHSLAAVTVRAAGWGIDVKEAQDNVPAPPGVSVPNGYRLVEYVGSGTKPVTLPWRAPKMLRVLGENSQLVGAWIGAGAPEEDPAAVFLRVFDLRVGSGARTKQTDEVLHTYASAITGASQVVDYVMPDDPHPHPSGHVCSAASSAGVARQLDPRWVYAGTIDKAERDKMQLGRVLITSPAGGKKSIPIWTDNKLSDGGYNRGRMPMRLVIQCPYSGQLFLFRMPRTIPGYAAAIGAGASADQLLAEAQAFLETGAPMWQMVNEMYQNAARSTAASSPCAGSIDASFAGLLEMASSQSCSAALLAVQAAKIYAGRCAAAAQAAANARPCPALDLSAEQAQGTPWGVIWNGQANCLDPSMVSQVGNQVRQAQASVNAAIAAKNAACPPVFRGVPVRSGLPLRLGAGAVEWIGAGQTPPSIQALLQQYGNSPAISSAWSKVSDQIQQELAQGVISQGDVATLEGSAAQHFSDAFNGLTQNYNPQFANEFAGIGGAAASFAAGNNTVAGSVSSVYGLLGPVLSGQSPDQSAVQLFTGTLAAAVPLAVAAGAVSAGVGAAIVVGVTLVGQLLGGLFNQSQPSGTMVCGWSSPYNPQILIQHPDPTGGCVWSAGAPRNSPGSGPTPWQTSPDKLWRRFPNPLNPADLWWFSVPSTNDPQQVLCANNCAQMWIHTWAPWGPQQDAWDALCDIDENPQSQGYQSARQRPIDAAFRAYKQIECDLAAAAFIALLPDSGGMYPGIDANGVPQFYQASPDDVMLARFMVGFAQAWKANAEYTLNGLQPKYSDDVMLAHYLRQWNYAHKPGAGFALQPFGNADLSSATFWSDPCQQAPFRQHVWYAQMLLQLPQFGGAAQAVNTGARRDVSAVHIGPIKLGGGGFGGFNFGDSGPDSTHPLLTATLILGGTAAATAAGVGVYAWRTKTPYKKAWRDIFNMLRNQSTSAGKSLLHAGAREGRRRRRR